MKRLILLFLLYAASAQAAVIHLRDGSQVRGTVVSATARDIQVHTDSGELRIETDKILRIDYAETGASSPPAPAAPRPTRSYYYEREPFQVENHPQLFSLVLGMSAPLSEVDFSAAGGSSANNGGAGILLGLQYLYHTKPRLGLGVDFSYFNRSADTQSLLPSANTRVEGDTLLLLGVLKYSLIDYGPARPYLLAGVGANRTSTRIDGTPNLGFIWNDTNTDETRRVIDGTHWGFASTARVGIDFQYLHPVMFSLELGWTGLENNGYDATQAGRDLGLNSVTGSINVLNVIGRWGWRF